MSKIAFIYPGQGAQKAGMGADFYEKSEIAKHIFNQAGEELDLEYASECGLPYHAGAAKYFAEKGIEVKTAE